MKKNIFDTLYLKYTTNYVLQPVFSWSILFFHSLKLYFSFYYTTRIRAILFFSKMRLRWKLEKKFLKNYSKNYCVSDIFQDKSNKVTGVNFENANVSRLRYRCPRFLQKRNFQLKKNYQRERKTKYWTKDFERIWHSVQELWLSFYSFGN